MPRALATEARLDPFKEFKICSLLALHESDEPQRDDRSQHADHVPADRREIIQHALFGKNQSGGLTDGGGGFRIKFPIADGRIV